MKNVTILAMFNTMASTVTGPMDIFHQAGVLWNHFSGKKVSPHFKVKIVTSNGAPFRCLNGARLIPEQAMDAVQHTDLIIVSSILDIERTLNVQGEVIDWLIERHRGGAHIATICTGAFVLAETGLLDGKTATTHWGYADQFERRYPKIDFTPERLITDEGDLFCSGGYNAGIDLSLYLVEKYCGRRVALQSAKAAVADLGRTSQAPYGIFRLRKDHQDTAVLRVQEWIETNFQRNFTYDELSRDHGMSRRTLERRFKNATGDTPLLYQQRVRVEAAKRMLEAADRSFDEITYRVGYEDSSSFRKMFMKQTGLRPTEYRRTFQRFF